jgi:hypothetical protein
MVGGEMRDRTLQKARVNRQNGMPLRSVAPDRLLFSQWIWGEGRFF